MVSSLYCFTIFFIYCVSKVGLLGLGRALQRDLNRIANTADTSTSEGLSYVVTGELYQSVPSHLVSVYFSCEKLLVSYLGQAMHI